MKHHGVYDNSVRMAAVADSLILVLFRGRINKIRHFR